MLPEDLVGDSRHVRKSPTNRQQQQLYLHNQQPNHSIPSPVLLENSNKNV